MRKKTKTVFKRFDYLHCDDLARYLEDMATKGWHFTRWGIGLTFEKGELEKAVYTVEIFNKAGDDDLRPTPDTEEFADYCEVAGWKFIDARKKFCIFKKSREDAAELFTPEERVINACEATLNSPVLTLVLSGTVMLLLPMIIFRFFPEKVFSGEVLLWFSVCSLEFVECLYRLIYIRWQKRRLCDMIQKGDKLHIGTGKNRRCPVGIWDIRYLIILLLLCDWLLTLLAPSVVLCGVVVAISLFAILAEIKPNRDTRAGIEATFLGALILALLVTLGVSDISAELFLASHEREIPLGISDYRENTQESRNSATPNSNLLGSYKGYYVFSGDNKLFYDIYRSRVDWILDKIWDGEMRAKQSEILVDCTEEWAAWKTVRDESGVYYVRCEGAVIILEEVADVDLTPEQIGIICEKLEIR